MFNGTPVIEQISLTELRITGLTLSPSATGTIAWPGMDPAPDVTLPDTFPFPVEDNVSFGGQPASLAALVKIDINPVSGADGGPFTNLQPSVVKTGDQHANFRIEITNTNTSETTQTLEIYVTLLGQAQSVAGGLCIQVTDSPKTRIQIG